MIRLINLFLSNRYGSINLHTHPFPKSKQTKNLFSFLKKKKNKNRSLSYIFSRNLYLDSRWGHSSPCTTPSPYVYIFIGYPSSIYFSSFFPCISAWYLNPKLEWLDTIEVYFFKFKQVLLILQTVALLHAMIQGSIVSNTTLLSLPSMSSHSSQPANRERRGTWIIPCRGVCFF